MQELTAPFYDVSCKAMCVKPCCMAAVGCVINSPYIVYAASKRSLSGLRTQATPGFSHYECAVCRNLKCRFHAMSPLCFSSAVVDTV